MKTTETKFGPLRYFDKMNGRMYNVHDLCKILKIEEHTVDSVISPSDIFVTVSGTYKDKFVNRNGVCAIYDLIADSLSPEYKISFFEWIDSIGNDVSYSPMNDDMKRELRRFSDYIEHHINDIVKTNEVQGHVFIDAFKNGKLLELYLRLRENKIL